MSVVKALYVDDEADIREIAAMSLELDPGFEVRTADGGADALRLLDSGWRPDIFLLDVMMPGMDGPRLLQEIRTRPEHEKTPAVFVTARARPHERHAFICAGAIGVIAKPFDPLTLSREVRALLAEAA